jgi:hypothetical protein
MFQRESLIALSLSLAFVSNVLADCCDHCGCDCGCRKVCHLKCDVKKVTKIEYSCECEDFCVPGKSQKCGTKCECHCKQCLLGCREHCCEKPVYKPTCAEVHTKKKLIKHEVTKEVPTYKWVVETVCDDCACRCLTCKAGQSRKQVEAEAMAKSDTDEEPPQPVAQPEPEAPKATWWNGLVGRK